ncbi:glutamate--tRNA ligase [Candidatus Shapirobacteria bacterium CG09_land_8_20_14_0_10_39_12]|uniref:Glutamate--tRNA ligase n=1 Tax=Candidatus Shapirobacteria bacterium CG09_land_8_20_14_0_10_39_12 TaxID=1974885 RepID=A0A2H0WQ48_9BACT|nr:MAG: glutamate--tRNA ligase [Candidatus Shapirobacteria bacterium CG09_land_8_20_14_0_10_39_12]
MSQIRTRFAPSPTGSMHIGNLRTALYAYALAKHSDGKFILRIEDTDKKREVQGIVDEIKEQLSVFKLIWDEYYVQSERLNLYKKAAQKLVEENHAFYCQCLARNAKEEGYSEIVRDPCRDKNLKSGAIKLKVPAGEKISFKDFVLDKVIEWSTDTVPDTTLLKSEEEGALPTYHLAAVVDDHEMKISHVLRGHDWMPSTPVHLLVYKYLGFEPPQIGHLTDILDPDGGKLSKRKGSVSVKEMLAEGYLPEALLNFIMLLGWAPKDNRELFTLQEFVENFQKGSLQIANPVFNRKKLDWFNGEYIRQLSVDQLNSLFIVHCSLFSSLNPKKQIAITKLVQDRIVKLSDFNTLAGFLFERPKVDVSLFSNLSFKEHLKGAISSLASVSDWTNETIQTSLTSLISQNNWKTGDFFMSFRIALSGSKFTPPITNCAEILGKEETLSRLKSVL